MFLESKVRRVRRADKLTAICELCLDNVGSLTFQNLLGLKGLLRGQLSFLYFINTKVAFLEI
jgi:hypothetical protein